MLFRVRTSLVGVWYMLFGICRMYLAENGLLSNVCYLLCDGCVCVNCCFMAVDYMYYLCCVLCRLWWCACVCFWFVVHHCFVLCCVLIVVCWLLIVVCCGLFVILCMLSVVMLMMDTHLLFAVCCLPISVCRLSDVCVVCMVCLPFDACHEMFHYCWTIVVDVGVMMCVVFLYVVCC